LEEELSEGQQPDGERKALAHDSEESSSKDILKLQGDTLTPLPRLALHFPWVSYGLLP